MIKKISWTVHITSQNTFFLKWDMKILKFASKEIFCIIVTGQHIHSVQYYEASQFHFFTLQVVLCLPWKKAESIIATVTIVEDMVNLHYFRVLPWSNIRNAAMNNMNKKYENISPFSSFPYWQREANSQPELISWRCRFCFITTSASY